LSAELTKTHSFRLFFFSITRCVLLSIELTTVNAIIHKQNEFAYKLTHFNIVANFRVSLTQCCFEKVESLFESGCFFHVPFAVYIVSECVLELLKASGTYIVDQLFRKCLSSTRSTRGIIDLFKYIVLN